MDGIALKIQRRRYSREAVREIAIYQQLRERAGISPEIIGMREAFLHDGHVCMAFERHGNSLDAALDRGAIQPARARRATRQMLLALERLHSCGYAHTDVKPGNILYSARSGEARLADLGDAERRLRQGTLYGTREYTSPEVILGAPLSRSLDLWNLGCTVFEMITGQLLFNPRRSAARKYREFGREAEKMNFTIAASVIKDYADEKAEQLARGNIIAGKYRLKRALGQGRFSTVWATEQLADMSVDSSREILKNNGRGLTVQRSCATSRQRSDREWRHKKGAADLLDLALNYEQLLLIAALCGPFPSAMVESARYRTSYFEEDGELRFRPRLKRASLRDRLRRAPGLKDQTLDLAADFLRAILTIDPALRPTARIALAHPWAAEA